MPLFQPKRNAVMIESKHQVLFYQNGVPHHLVYGTRCTTVNSYFIYLVNYQTTNIVFRIESSGTIVPHPNIKHITREWRNEELADVLRAFEDKGIVPHDHVTKMAAGESF